MMLTQGAIGNLINRYSAVLKKCSLMNTFGSLALAALLVLGGAGAAGAAINSGMNWGNLTIDKESFLPSSVWIDGTKPTGTGNLGNVIINNRLTPDSSFVVGNGDVVVGGTGSIELNDNDVFWVSQGNLTVAKGGTLFLSNGRLHVGGDVEIQEGSLRFGGNTTLYVGKNLTVNGEFEQNNGNTTVKGTLTVDSLDMNSGTLTAEKLILTNSSATQQITDGTVTIGTLEATKLDITDGTGHSIGTAKVTGTLVVGTGTAQVALRIGQLQEGSVTIGGNSNGEDSKGSTLTLGKEGVITEHSTAGITISNGTLKLQGSNTITGDVTLNGVAAGRSATLSSSSGNNTVDNVTVANNYNNITVAQGGTLNLGTVTVENVSGTGSTLNLGSAGVASTIVIKDNLEIQNQGTVTIKGGTVQLDSTKLTTTGSGGQDGKLVVEAGTAHFTDTNGIAYAMDQYAANTGNVGTDKNVKFTGGTLRVDNALILKSGGNRLSVGATTAVDNFKGNIIANTLTTQDKDGAGVDLSITAGTVQLVGKGVSNTLFTGKNNEISVHENGKLVLGALKGQGFTSEDEFNGTIDKIQLSSPTSQLQFGHGNFKVDTLDTPSGNAGISFNDTTGFGSTNEITFENEETALVITNENGKIKEVTLGEGTFKIVGGLKADSGKIKIAVGAGKTGGYVGEITLGSGGNLIAGTDHKGVYTITEVGASLNSAITVDGGTVIVEKLSGNSSTLTTGTGGTLLLDQNVRLNGNTVDVGDVAPPSHTLKSNAGTFGTTGKLEFTSKDNKITIGATTSVANTGTFAGSYIAGTVNSSMTGAALTITGGSKLTVTGMGENGKLFLNIGNVIVGDATSGEGTLALGGNAANNGGNYANTLTLGNATNKGTLEFNGSKIELSTVVVADNAKAEYVFNAGKTDLTINTGTDKDNLKAGINLTNANQTVTLKNGAIATVNGGINVTTGTVNLAGGTLKNEIKLDGTVDDANINVTSGVNTVGSITVAEGKAGTVDLAADSALVVNSDLDLHKALLTMTAGTTATDKENETIETTTTLYAKGTLTTGKVTDNTSVPTAAGNFHIAAGNGSAAIIATGLWTVQDADGNAAAINLTDDTNNVNLVIATAGIEASDFNIGKDDTVSLQGKGGEITLTGTDAVLDVKGTLNVGDATVASTWKTDKVTVGESGSGALNVNNNGSLTVNTLELSTGAITVGTAGDDKIAATSGKLFVTDFTSQKLGNSSAFNITKGAAYFGTTADSDFANAADTVLSGTEGAVAMLAVNKAVDFSNVNMVVGTKLQGDDTFTEQFEGGGNIEFGADSVTVIGHDAAQTDYAITTNGNVYIDKGAKLELYREGGLQLKDTYKILQTTGGTIGNIWEASNVLASQRLVKLELSQDHDTVSGTIAEANVAAGFGNKLDSDFAHILGNMLANSGVDVASEQYGVRFLSRSTDRNFIADDTEAAATIEGGAKIAFAGAAPHMAMNLANTAGSIAGLRNSLSAAPQGAAVALNDEGLVAHEGLSAGEGMQNGFGLWVMPTYQNQQGFGLESGEFETGYKSNAAGVILGADYTFNDMFRVGAQFNVGGGYAESTGDFNSTSNRFKYWGLGLYAGYQYENIGVTADFGYSKNNNELEQNLPDGMQMANLKADAHSDTLTAGLRGEYKFATEALDIVPHIGVRMTNMHMGSFDVKSDKHTIFKADDVNATVWTFPVGVNLSKEFETGNGWTVKPSLDLAVIPAVGDIEAKQDINVVGVSGSAQVESNIMDHISYQGSVGLSAKHDNGVSVGVNYTLQAGAHTTDQGVQATLRYDF